MTKGKGGQPSTSKPSSGLVTRGHQPKSITNPGNVQGGHQPTTGQGGSGSPPNQGGGGSKK